MSNARATWTVSVGIVAALSWIAVWFSHSHSVIDDVGSAVQEGNARNTVLSFSSRRIALGEFRWPGRDEWLDGHGFQNNAVVAGELESLRSYYHGATAKVARSCAKRFGVAGEEITKPAQGNLGCLGWMLDVSVRPKQLEKEIAALELKSKKLDSAAALSLAQPAGGTGWNSLAKLPYRMLLSKFEFDDIASARKMFRDARKRQSQCTEASARAALRMSIEKFLPSREAFSMIENLYASASACLKSDHPAYETLHLRTGLLYIERNEFKKAAKALLRASHSERPIEETRVAFWLGFLDALNQYEGDGKFAAHRNPWWERLEKAQPLSLHAVAARHLMGRDSAELLKTADVPTLAVYQGDKWNGRNYWAFLMVLARALGDKEMQQTLVETQMSYLRTADFDDTLFYALAEREADAKKASFRTVQSGIRLFGTSRMSKGVLSLLFPLHFIEDIAASEECRDPALVLSLIRQESSFEKEAMSSRGAQGLMQLLPSVAKQRLGKENVDLNNPSENIRAGCLHLAAMMKDFDNEALLAVASFNAGSLPVRKWQARFDKRSLLLFADLIPFQETRHFVANVFAGDYWYGTVLNAQPGLKLRSSVGLPVGMVPIPEDFGLNDSMEIEIAPPDSPK